MSLNRYRTIQCNGLPCYIQSFQSYSVCKPSYVDIRVTSDDLWHYFPFQLGYLSVLWFLLVSLNVLELILQKAHHDQSAIDLAVIHSSGKCKDFMNKYKEIISLLFGLVAFTLPIMLLYHQNFQTQSFCLMNSQEPICQNNWKALSLDCLELANKPNSSIKSFISSFSAVIKSGWFL